LTGDEQLKREGNADRSKAAPKDGADKLAKKAKDAVEKVGSS
jgi:uncharacterized protein YjbJ (UPF0337 family)